MTKCVGEILLCNSERLLRELRQILGGYFLPHPIYVIRCLHSNVYCDTELPVSVRVAEVPWPEFGGIRVFVQLEFFTSSELS